MAPRTRSKARVEAPASLFDGLNDDLQNMIVWATTEGGVAKPAAALRGVNKKLRAMVEATHTWHNEWVDAWMERDALEGDYLPRSTYETGGDLSIEQSIEQLAQDIKWKINKGWSRKQAEAHSAITSSLNAPLAAAVRDRSDPDPAVRARSERYAASTRVVCEALAQQAKLMTQPAPLLYINLTGTFGLATLDPAWEALTQSDASAGLSLVTNGIVRAEIADSYNFPDDKGFYKCIYEDGKDIRAAGL